MEQCACVERELEKVLHRFVMYGHQSEERLDELLRSVCEIRGQLVAFGKKNDGQKNVHYYFKLIHCKFLWEKTSYKFCSMAAVS